MSDGDVSLDKFIDGLADKLLEDTAWDEVLIVNGLLAVKKITKEEKEKNREKWR